MLFNEFMNVTFTAKAAEQRGTGSLWPVPGAQRRIRGFKATGETRRVPEVSKELGSKAPPTKN